jgi:hypothetical protein
MLTVSSQFLSALRGPQVIATEAIAYPPTGNPIVLPIEDGAVTSDRTADNRRQLDLTVSDPTLYPLAPTDPLSVYGTEVIVKRGLTFANDTTELLQLGIFRIESCERQIPGGGVQITGYDRSRQVADTRFITPRKLASQTAVSLIETLITEVYPLATFSDLSGDSTTIPKHVVQQDRWGEIKRVAQVIGCEVFVMADGVWRIQPVPDPTTALTVWSVDAGETGVLISADDVVTREGAANIFVAIGESVSGNTAPFTSQSPHGYDNDPTSPTYYLGAYGKVPVYYQSPHIRTQAQANKVADALLHDHLGASRTINFAAVPNPALLAGDAVTIVRPDGSTELHVLDSLSIPLTSAGQMTAETRVVDWGQS